MGLRARAGRNVSFRHPNALLGGAVLRLPPCPALQMPVKATDRKSNGCALPFSRKMSAGENPMAWFYEIRDSNNVVTETGKGFATHNAAIAAGRKRARELKASGSLPGGGVGTVGTGQDSEVLPR